MAQMLHELFAFVMEALPDFLGLQIDKELAVIEEVWVGSVFGPPQLGNDRFDLRVGTELAANLMGQPNAFFDAHRMREACSNPKRPLIQLGQKLTSGGHKN